MNIQEMIHKYKKIGYSDDDASAKVCQDIILMKISKSQFSKNITIKGGVVMHSISNDIRRATRDLDLDFIKYSLNDESIINFINSLNHSDSSIKLEIVGKIKPLHHQCYDGKRVIIKLSDSEQNIIESKLDIGVHTLFDLKQEDYCFDFDIINKSAKLIINSKEQIFVEKLKSLLKLGIRSTRYKDIFDFYYLINYQNLNKNNLFICFDILIFSDSTMKEQNMQDIIKRLKSICNSKMYKKNLLNPKVNWLDVPIDDAINSILAYLEELETIPV